MSEQRATALTTLCAAACIALALGRVVDVLFAPACLLFVLFKRVVLDRLRFGLPDLVFVLAHALLFVFFLLFAIFNDLARDDLAVLLGFATLWMMLRLFAEQTPYNDFLIVLSSLVIAVGSAGVAPGLLPVAITALHLIALCHTMPTIMARRDRDEGVTVRLIGRADGWSVSGGFAVHHLSLGGLLLGALVYLVVPRLDTELPGDPDGADGLLAARQARRGTAFPLPAHVTGFPSSVHIGDIGKIKRSNQRAFDAWLRLRGVAFDPPENQRTMLLLRAEAWDAYDPRRRRWTRWEAGRSELPASGVISEGEAPLDWKVRLHGYDGRTLFLPARARGIRSTTRPLFIDWLGRITSLTRVEEYAVEADIPPTSTAAIGRLRPGTRARLLEVDAGLGRQLQPYLRELGVPSLPSSGHILRVTQAIRSYFTRRGFRYTLQLPALPEDKDPVVAFLERREGHCELYASAACLFLRLAQIPARLAGGVRCAERVEKGHYRAYFRNAHAWVEVYCRGIGFVAFDFTPEDSRAVAPGGGGTAGAGREPAGGVGMDWTQPFRYGQREQRWLIRSVRDKLGRFVLPGLGLGLALAIGIAVLRQVRRPRRGGLRVHPPPGVTRRTLVFYVKWLKACAARGHSRRRSETPREFLASLPAELRADGRDITAKFESLRYGPGG